MRPVESRCRCRIVLCCERKVAAVVVGCISSSSVVAVAWHRPVVPRRIVTTRMPSNEAGNGSVSSNSIANGSNAKWTSKLSRMECLHCCCICIVVSWNFIFFLIFLWHEIYYYFLRICHNEFLIFNKIYCAVSCLWIFFRISFFVSEKIIILIDLRIKLLKIIF